MIWQVDSNKLGLGVGMGLFVATPLILTLCSALCVSIKHKLDSPNISSSTSSSSIYTGTVYHNRFGAIPNKFNYPLFFTLVDLNQIENIMSHLFPLSLFARFNPKNHLRCITSADDISSINNDLFEEIGADNSTAGTDKNSSSLKSPPPSPIVVNGKVISFTRPVNTSIELTPTKSAAQKPQQQTKKQQQVLTTMSEKLINLVSKRTRNRCIPTGKILLLTHLEYFGYNFNPVSFYYLLDGRDMIECIVAEVGNTPWNEQFLYVLHPKSSDITNYEIGRNNDIRFVFDKQFHVSPFMGMEMVYDWTFSQIGGKLSVVTHMIEKAEIVQNEKNPKKIFTAAFTIYKKEFSVGNLAWELARLPCYCGLIQFWIHFEAMILYIKGAQFMPHPENSRSWASDTIGFFMLPFERVAGLRRKR